MTTARPLPTSESFPRKPGSRGSGSSTPRTGAATAGIVVRKVFGADNANFFLLLGTTLFLVAFGLVMVLSSSSIDDGAAKGHDFFSTFTKQGLYALIGIPLMLIASRMRLGFWKRWAWPAVMITALLQLAVFVPGLRYSFQGNTNWIRIGSFTAQPSELVKLALILWIGWVLARKQSLLDNWKHVALPLAPVAAVELGLVLAGGDLGTAMVLVAIVLGLLFFAGVKLRFIGVTLLALGAGALLMSQVNSSRTSRISAFLGGCTSNTDFLGSCWQTIQGKWAIASGGIFGSGLGESKVKWGWLPEADNDFLFAIIGEELGLVGAVLVLVLFAILAIAFIRIIRTSNDPFARIVTGGVMVWLIGQAFVNIAVVLGLLPVFGVPLPFLSAGGSSLIASLVGVGVVLSFTRRTADPRIAPAADPRSSVAESSAS